MVVLYLRAEEFRNSPSTTMTEQSFVVKKFFISLVAHARNVFVEANREADAWLKELVNPLVGQIQEMRNSTERHMKTLSRIRESKDSLETQLRELRAGRASLIERKASLEKFHSGLLACTPPPPPADPARKRA